MNKHEQETKAESRAGNQDSPPSVGGARESRDAQRLGDGSPAVEPRSPARDAQETQGEPPAKGPSR